jgi:hypothetical protein
MQITFLKGYPDFVGKRAQFAGFGSGPSSYSQTTGDVISLPLTNWYIDSIDGAPLSVSGTYFVRAQPAATGPRQSWALHWFVTSTGSEVGAAVNLSAEKIQLGGKIGQY